MSTNVFFELHQVHIVPAGSFFLQIWMSKLHSHVRISKSRMIKTHCIYNISVSIEDEIKTVWISRISQCILIILQLKTKTKQKQFQRLIHISTRFELLSPFIHQISNHTSFTFISLHTFQHWSLSFDSILLVLNWINVYRHHRLLFLWQPVLYFNKSFTFELEHQNKNAKVLKSQSCSVFFKFKSFL